METQKPAMSIRGRLRQWLGFGILDAKIVILRGMVENQAVRIHDLEGELYQFRSALKSKAQSAFDKPDDKIPASPARYIPVARRRAQAERASAGPQNHTDQVRANNAKVLETL